MFQRRNPPRGQMIVVVALVLTILVAMVGVVVDGGFALSNRRQVQNTADAAALAGTRVLGLDLKWRAGTALPANRPFADADIAVCDAINSALTYDQNVSQTIAPIDCYGPGTSPNARYVFLTAAGGIQDFSPQRNVGDGIPANAQGVRVDATGSMDTLLIRVVGISTIDIGADATALAGPAEPPIGLLMPFVVQNPLGPFIPGNQYQSRSTSEGECGASVLQPVNVASGGGGLVLAAAALPAGGALLPFAAQPNVPVAVPDSTTFVSSISVTLSAKQNETIYYTTDLTDPTDSATRLTYTSALTFTSTTILKAVAKANGNGQISNVGTFTYTQINVPEAPTASPGNGTVVPPAVNVTLQTVTSGAVIYYTLDGSTPTTSSTVYTGPIPISVTTQIKAIAANSGGAQSSVATFNYTSSGTPQPPTATPGDGTSFETTQNVTLATTTSGAKIYYTLDGSTPTTSSLLYSGSIALVSTTTIKAMAEKTGAMSLVVSFTYTKTGPVCPDLTSGGFGWIDFNGGSGGNNDLKQWIEFPETAPTSWYYTPCTTATDYSCRELHDVADSADDHWKLLGTTGNRNVSLNIACTTWLDKEIYVPIWDKVETVKKSSNPQGHNAVFHIIGFAVFRLDGIIDNKANGDPSADACGDGLNFGGPKNDKGFIGTYVDSFVGTKVAPCIAVGTNPCAGLDSQGLTINLAE